MTMSMDRLEGVWKILPTPFYADRRLDVESITPLTDLVVGTGVDGMTVLGVLG